MEENCVDKVLPQYLSGNINSLSLGSRSLDRDSNPSPSIEPRRSVAHNKNITSNAILKQCKIFHKTSRSCKENTVSAIMNIRPVRYTKLQWIHSENVCTALEYTFIHLY